MTAPGGRRVRGVLLDMDGVLLDTERLSTTLLPEMIRQLGYEPPADLLDRIRGTNVQTCSRIYQEVFGDGFPREELNRRYFHALMQRAESGDMPLKPGLKACFEGLRSRGLRTALATSTDRNVVEHYMRYIPLLRTAFDETVCGMEIISGKPAPDIYQKAAEKLHLLPEDCVGAEDSRNGLMSLRAAHCCSVMIPDMLPYSAELTPYVDFVLHDLTELCPLIDRLNGEK